MATVDHVMTTNARFGVKRPERSRVLKVVRVWFKTCSRDEIVNSKSITTVLVWTLALLLPGGFALLALYLSYRAAKAKQVLVAVRADRPSRLSVLPSV
jgi:hypothetical protein